MSGPSVVDLALSLPVESALAALRELVKQRFGARVRHTPGAKPPSTPTWTLPS